MALADLLHGDVLLLWFLGMVFGVFVGATPGLTATMAVAMLVPLALKVEPAAGLAMIVGVSFTAIFAGDIPATFLRIPGTPASAAATLDGFQMARKGRAREALMIDLLCSAIGGLIGVGLLVLIAPQLAKVALMFSDAEKFWLAVLGLSMSALVSQGSTWKGIIAALLGMLLATVGQDVFGMGARFTLGFGALNKPSSDFLIPAMIGLFGLSEVLRSVRRREAMKAGAAPPDRSWGLGAALRAMARNWWTILQSSALGTVIGALPGAGADIAAWAAYGAAQRTSRKPEEFGSGCEEGVVAPTSANNAAVAGAWIPALVFGVPGDAVTAIVLPMFVVYNLRPGPAIFESAEVYTIFVIAAITQLLLIPAGWFGIYGFGLILRLPRSIVLTAVVLFSAVGAYTINESLVDVGIMIAFGALGFYLESQRVPLAPLILGLILGGDMMERHLRNVLLVSDGDWTVLFTRPISMVLWMLLLAVMLGPLAFKLLRRVWRRPSSDS